MSLYSGLPPSQWKEKTKELVSVHPLNPLKSDEIKDVVLEAWSGILNTKIAGELKIGTDVFPSPQILGNYLHELIPAILEKRHPGLWKKDVEKKDKDLVYLPDNRFSTEIKTSSNPNNIFGNASYGVEDSANTSAKSKDGYYLAINFEKFDPKNPEFVPRIRKIRFGWLDHSDWHSQNASSGQAATISPEVRDNKLLLIYDYKA